MVTPVGSAQDMLKGVASASSTTNYQGGMTSNGAAQNNTTSSTSTTPSANKNAGLYSTYFVQPVSNTINKDGINSTTATTNDAKSTVSNDLNMNTTIETNSTEA